MRHFQVLIAAMLFFTITVAAQGPGARSAPASAGASRYGDPSAWQLAIGYQYNRINLTGSAFHTNGYNVSLARYFGRWFGLEGQLGFGFGNTGTTTSPANLTAKSIFAGGGPRLAYRGHFVEPWIHAVGGM